MAAGDTCDITMCPSWFTGGQQKGHTNQGQKQASYTLTLRSQIYLHLVSHNSCFLDFFFGDALGFIWIRVKQY